MRCASCQESAQSPLAFPLRCTAQNRPSPSVLKLASPLNHECKPDLDNLAKAVLDAMTVGGWWGDDCQITDLRVRKEWAGVGQLAGCGIEIRAQMLLR